MPKSLSVHDYLTQEQAEYAVYKLHQRLTKPCL